MPKTPEPSQTLLVLRSLQKQLAGLRTDTMQNHAQLAAIRAELHREMSELRDDVKGSVGLLLAALERLTDRIDTIAHLSPRITQLEDRVTRLEQRN